MSYPQKPDEGEQMLHKETNVVMTFDTSPTAPLDTRRDTRHTDLLKPRVDKN
jgi:hypothetical protein